MAGSLAGLNLNLSSSTLGTKLGYNHSAKLTSKPTSDIGNLSCPVCRNVPVAMLGQVYWVNTILSLTLYTVSVDVTEYNGTALTSTSTKPEDFTPINATTLSGQVSSLVDPIMESVTMNFQSLCCLCGLFLRFGRWKG